MGNRVKISHKSRYAPIRYEATRPYAMRFGKLFMAAARNGAAARMAFVQKDLLPLLVGEIRRLGKPDGPGPGQGEITNVQVYAGYQNGGRQVFDVRSELAKSLLVTDYVDIPCETLTFPLQAFYLHFGSGTGLVDDGMEIEGAFVQHLPDEQAMLIDLVPAGMFSVSEFWRLPRGEQMTGVRIDLDRPSEAVANALDRSLDKLIENNRAIFQQMADLERQLAAQYGQPIKVPSPVENLENKRDLLHRALRLVINTLFFLMAAPEDVQEDWEEETPADLMAQLSSEKFGTRKTAENRLANEGYVKVRFIGRHYSASAGARAVSEALASGRAMPTHLRRGHFRNQPYGPERALRRTVFIAPTVVNAGKGEPLGRVYDFSTQ